MLLGLFVLFTLVPLVELYLLIQLGTYIGAVDTIVIVIGTGVAGGLLAKSQGLAVFDRIRAELNQGRLPAGESLGWVADLDSRNYADYTRTPDGWLGVASSDSLEPEGFQILAQGKDSGEDLCGGDSYLHPFALTNPCCSEYELAPRGPL